MRSIQRGITTTFIIVIILAGAVSIASVYFTYTLNKKPSINSFEDCAKLYPVMESYPEQCNTPDGKHFTRELSEEEKQRLVPPNEPSPVLISESSKSCMRFKHPKFDSAIIQFMNSNNPELFKQTYDIDLYGDKIRVDVSTFEEKSLPETNLIEVETTLETITEGLVKLEDLCKLAEIEEVRFIEIPSKGQITL